MNNDRALIDDCLKKNAETLKEHFEGIASCSHQNGQPWLLCWNMNQNSVYIESSENATLDDGEVICRVQSYYDVPLSQRYSAARGDDIEDYGYLDYLDEVRERMCIILDDKGNQS